MESESKKHEDSDGEMETETEREKEMERETDKVSPFYIYIQLLNILSLQPNSKQFEGGNGILNFYCASAALGTWLMVNSVHQ